MGDQSSLVTGTSVNAITSSGVTDFNEADDSEDPLLSTFHSRTCEGTDLWRDTCTWVMPRFKSDPKITAIRAR